MRTLLSAVFGLALLSAPVVASAHPRFGHERGYVGRFVPGWRPGVVVAPPVFYPPGVAVGPIYRHGPVFHRYGWR